MISQAPWEGGGEDKRRQSCDVCLAVGLPGQPEAQEPGLFHALPPRA